MLRILSDNKFPFLIWSLLLIAGVGVFVFLGKPESHLLINRFHNDSLDFLMPVITNLGDGLVMLGLAILFLFRKIRYFFIFIFSFLSTSIVVQVLKRMAFSDYPRPVKYFEGSEYSLYLIDGLKYHSYFSFPSGHSATAFAMFIGLALLTRNQLLKFCFLFIACIVAFSRVYLSQHFLIDIIAGSIIGVLFALIAHFWFIQINKKWMDLPIYKVMNRR